MGAGDMNSGLHEGAASTFTTELSSQFLTVYLLHVTAHLVMHKGQGKYSPFCPSILYCKTFIKIQQGTYTLGLPEP